jgi:3-deoxy-manno-octulosonate cytidylyltransferase (CMP-KDO synthetase)
MPKTPTLGIIPARYASTRLPGKPLLEINGRTLIEWVYQRALQAGFDHLVVATDDQRIADAVAAFGGRAMMTRADHQTGTDRCAEIVEALQFEGLVVNIQGDEPLADPTLMQQLAQRLETDTEADIVTAAAHWSPDADLLSPHLVKVITNHRQQAMYFSRWPVPYMRDEPQMHLWPQKFGYRQHIGLYAYRSAFLSQLKHLEPTAIEKAESLEQLRWLYYGYRIAVVDVDHVAVGVDTPHDLEQVRQILSTREP